MNGNRDSIYSLIRSMSGQANILTIPRIFVSITKSHRAALLLSQSIYWSDRATAQGGWFYKSYREWLEEIGLNQHAVETGVKLLRELDLIETKVQKVGTRLTRWYRPNMERLAELIEVTLAETANVKPGFTLEETDKVPQRKPIRSSIKQRLRSETTDLAPDGAQTPKPRKRSVREEALAALEQHFSRESSIPLPERDTEAQEKAAAKRWWGPLATIWKQCDQNVTQAEGIITRAITLLRGKNLTVASPQSIEQTAIGLIAAEKRTPEGTPALSNPILIAIAEANHA